MRKGLMHILKTRRECMCVFSYSITQKGYSTHLSFRVFSLYADRSKSFCTSPVISRPTPKNVVDPKSLSKMWLNKPKAISQYCPFKYCIALLGNLDLSALVLRYDTYNTFLVILRIYWKILFCMLLHKVSNSFQTNLYFITKKMKNPPF
jgi:hypothetical protein